MSKQMIVVRRPKDHHKGPKTIASWPYGERVPKGVLIGKDAVITVEPKKEVINGIQSKIT